MAQVEVARAREMMMAEAAVELWEVSVESGEEAAVELGEVSGEKNIQNQIKRAAEVNVSQKKKPALRFVRPKWFTRSRYWRYCWNHDVCCRRVERVVRLLDPNYPQDERKKKKDKKQNKQEHEEDMDLALLFDPRPQEHEHPEEKPETKMNLNVNLDDTYNLKGMFEEPQEEEESYKDTIIQPQPQPQPKPEEKGKDNKKKKQQDKGKDKKRDAIIINYPPPAEKDQSWIIREGKKYNFMPSFFSQSRDYLIKYNGDQVKSRQLYGKYILLFFWRLSDDDRFEMHQYGIRFGFNEYLGELYSVYNPKGSFEVVFVALGNNEHAFHVSFSHMPWLAIPHEDQECRDQFIKWVVIPSSLSMSVVLFDPDGTAVCTFPTYVFPKFGPDGFPFTKQRIKQMCVEEDALLKELIFNKQKPSLTALFGDHVISNEGKQVHTSILEDKVVGLFFYSSSSTDFKQVETLVSVWKYMKLLVVYKNFEIVLINKTYREDLPLFKARFKEKFGDIPWYSLPHDYGRKLAWVLRVTFTD